MEGGSASGAEGAALSVIRREAILLARSRRWPGGLAWRLRCAPSRFVRRNLLVQCWLLDARVQDRLCTRREPNLHLSVVIWENPQFLKLESIMTQLARIAVFCFPLLVSQLSAQFERQLHTSAAFEDVLPSDLRFSDDLELGPAILDSESPVFRFPLDTGVSCLPLLMANGGLKTAEGSFFHKAGLALELVRPGDPRQAWEAYLAGELHFLAGCLADFARNAPAVAKLAPKAALRVMQIVDFDAGLCILAREGLSLADLLYPTEGSRPHIALQATPEARHLLLNFLFLALSQPEESARTYVSGVLDLAGGGYDAWVGRWPEEQALPEGWRVLLSGRQASRVVSHAWAARADVAQAHPEAMALIVQGFFEGMRLCSADPEGSAEAFAQATGRDPGGLAVRLEQLFWLNHFDAAQLYDATQPGGVRWLGDWLGGIFHGWKRAQSSEDRDGESPLVIQPLPELDGFYRDDPFHGGSRQPQAGRPGAEAEGSLQELLSVRVYIHFMPGSARINSDYDPGADFELRKLGMLIAQFPGLKVRITRHADRSKYEQAQEMGEEFFAAHSQRVLKLTEFHAGMVSVALREIFPSLEGCERISTRGAGWSQPLESDARSRRFQVQVFAPQP